MKRSLFAVGSLAGLLALGVSAPAMAATHPAASPSDYTISLSGPADLTQTSATFTADITGPANTSAYTGIVIYNSANQLVSPRPFSPQFVTVDATGHGTWTEALGGLQPGTAYHAIAGITDPDPNDQSSVASNTIDFTTPGQSVLPVGSVGVIGFVAILMGVFVWRLRRRQA